MYIFKIKLCVSNIDFSVFEELSAEGDILDSDRRNDDGIRESYVKRNCGTGSQIKKMVC
jgi:hypothetical protein